MKRLICLFLVSLLLCSAPLALADYEVAGLRSYDSWLALEDGGLVLAVCRYDTQNNLRLGGPEWLTCLDANGNTVWTCALPVQFSTVGAMNGLAHIAGGGYGLAGTAEDDSVAYAVINEDGSQGPFGTLPAAPYQLITTPAGVYYRSTADGSVWRQGWRSGARQVAMAETLYDVFELESGALLDIKRGKRTLQWLPQTGSGFSYTLSGDATDWFIEAAAQTESGEMLFVAQYIPFEESKQDTYLYCLSASGDLNWQKSLKGLYPAMRTQAIRIAEDGAVTLYGSGRKTQHDEGDGQIAFSATFDEKGNLLSRQETPVHGIGLWRETPEGSLLLTVQDYDRDALQMRTDQQ